MGRQQRNWVQTIQRLETSVPLVIMTYFNLLFQYESKNFFRDVEGTAVKGVIIPDLPHEHADLVEPLLVDKDIALVPLVSLTTGIERQKKLIQDAEGFIYAVAVNGWQGKAGSYRDDLDHHLAPITWNSVYSCFNRFWSFQHGGMFTVSTRSQMGLLWGPKSLRLSTKGRQTPLLVLFLKQWRVRSFIPFIISLILLDQALCLLF